MKETAISDKYGNTITVLDNGYVVIKPIDLSERVFPLSEVIALCMEGERARLEKMRKQWGELI